MPQPTNNPASLYSAYMQRAGYPPNDYMQGVLGPMEHKQAAQEMVSENPFMAIPLAAGIPLYSGGKALGAIPARSPASADEMFAGLEGVARGMESWWTRALDGFGKLGIMLDDGSGGTRRGPGGAGVRG